MLTKKQYMNKEVSHNEYYGQFVTENLIKIVVSHIGKEAILSSKCEHLNDIPLKKWDRLSHSIRLYVGYKISAANGKGGVSLSDTVCCAKEAARIYKQRKYHGKTNK